MANEEVTENDIKFISWDAFDFALDNDDGLFTKLVSLVDEEGSIPMLAEKLSHDTFTPLEETNNDNQQYVYRFNRNGASIH